MNLKLHKWEDLGNVIYCKEKVSNSTGQRGIERTSEDLMDLKWCRYIKCLKITLLHENLAWKRTKIKNELKLWQLYKFRDTRSFKSQIIGFLNTLI